MSRNTVYSGVVAWHERPSLDPMTGADGVLRKEWRVARMGNDLLFSGALEAAFGANWRNYHPGHEWLLEVKYIRRGKDEGWQPFQIASTRRQALEYVDDAATATDEELRAIQLRRVEADALEAAARKSAAAARESAERIKRHHAESEAAFKRMRDGSAEGKALAAAWCAWIEECQAGPQEQSQMWKSDATFMSMYNAVMDATRVPQKRAAVKAILKVYAPGWLKAAKSVGST